jgi:putative salt-induced outer membrane protein YdiY
MKIKFITVAVVGVLAAGSAPLIAQTNQAPAAVKAGPALTNAPNAVIKYPWQGSLSLGLTLTKGNSDTSLFTGKFLDGRKTPENEYSFDVDGSYGENDSVKSAELAHADGQWNHLFSDRLFSYVRTDALHDGISDVTYRFSVGPGAGYYFIKDKRTTLAGEGGVNWEFQDIGSGTNRTDLVYETLRLADRFEHKFSFYGARIWQNAEVLPQVDKFQHFLINGEIGIEAAIVKNLSLQMYVDDAYDSEPATDRKRNDVKLVSGVSYKF